MDHGRRLPQVPELRNVGLRMMMPIWVSAVARQYHSQRKGCSKATWDYFMEQAVRLISARVSNFDKAAFIRFAETLK